MTSEMSETNVEKLKKKIASVQVKGISRDEVMKTYKDWANTYDQVSLPHERIIIKDNTYRLKKNFRKTFYIRLLGLCLIKVNI